MIKIFSNVLSLFPERYFMMNFRRFTLAALCVMALSLTSACTKKIDGSSMEKYYLSSGEVMKSISGADRQMEFANGLEMILFYSNDAYETVSQLNGKTADEVFEMIQQVRDTKPRIDASRKERFSSSLMDVLKSIPNEPNRQSLTSQMTDYGFYPWNNKNMMNIRTLDGKNAFEVTQAIREIRRNEDPTKMNEKK